MKKMICVVGAGYWGKNHIKTLASLNALSGVVDLDKSSLKNIVSSYPEIKAFLNENNRNTTNFRPFSSRF